MHIKLYQLNSASYSYNSILLSQDALSLKFLSETCQSLINDKCYNYSATIEADSISAACSIVSFDKSHEYVSHWSDHKGIIEYSGVCKRPISNGDILTTHDESFIFIHGSVLKINISI